MTPMSDNLSFPIGSIVTARSREWIVQPGSTPDLLRLRPLAGSEKDDCVLIPSLESVPPSSSSFDLPDFTHPGDASQAAILRDALQMKLRNGAGPFRSFGNLAVEPRPYQFVPLLMALRLPVVRLLIADDVGLGKTIEAGLILREFLDRGEIDRAAILCPPHLVDQWVAELHDRFHIDAVPLTSRTADALERGLAINETIFSRHSFLVISLDYIKSERHRMAFLAQAPSFVIVDEAHTCATTQTDRRHYRWQLLRELATDSSRHLLLLTGTPHSGDTDAFYNLLSLLKPEFAALKDERAGDKALRAELARHFVQRRRKDIENDWGGTSVFPKREIAETTYRLTDEWSAYLNKIYEVCRTLANRTADNAARRQFYGFAALALLRCASSSPAAAVKAFDSKRQNESALPEDVEDSLPPVPGLFDDADDDDDETTPGSEATIAPFTSETVFDELRQQAEAFMAEKNDPKLDCLVDFLKKELLRGTTPFRPIVFCRYIATAQYVGEALRKKFSPKYAVGVVTGNDNPDERPARVAELVDSSERRILVATDCLSEGINLQDDFDAVIHYDMVWNPTRHEQREGRVDRFGQRRKAVRCALLYGSDNPVDGLVLSNIARKAEVIREKLGISVPVPVDDRRVKSAILKAFLMRRLETPLQMEFEGLFDDGTPDTPSINEVWEDARQREERNRTIFAQNAIHPDAVARELDKVHALLGTPADVERFVRNTLSALKGELGAPLGPSKDGVSAFNPSNLPGPLLERLKEAGFPISRELRLAFDPAAADRRPDVLFVRRTDPLVAVLADFVVESALSGQAPEGLRPASRCAVTRTSAVSRRTVLLVQRLRHFLRYSRGGNEKILVGEEIALFAAEAGGTFGPLAPGSDRARTLFDAIACENLTTEAKKAALAAAYRDLQARKTELEAAANARAAALLADHRAVRDASGALGSYSVKPVLPADTIGLYVFLPSI